MAKVNVRVRDHSDEYSNVAIYGADLLDAAPFSDAQTLADGFAAQIGSMTLGTVVASKFTQDMQAIDDTRPASEWAQREIGGRFYLWDNVQEKGSFITVPALDLGTVATIPGTDLIDLGQAPASTFVSWLEANVISEYGNPITVTKAVVVGRNS